MYFLKILLLLSFIIYNLKKILIMKCSATTLRNGLVFHEKEML